MEARLAIRRFEIAVEGPADRSDAVAQATVRAVRSMLGPRLFAQIPEIEGDAIHLVRRLALELDLVGGETDTEIADHIAGAIAAALGTMITTSPAMPRYSDQAARIAAFLTALIDGRAWDRWWFNAFEGVRLLAVSAAARTILLRDPSLSPAVWRALDVETRSRLLARLSPTDATFLAEALTSRDAPVPTDADWEMVAAALGAALQPTAECKALAALVAVSVQRAGPLPVDLVEAAQAAAILLMRPAPADRRIGLTAAEAESAHSSNLPPPLQIALAARRSREPNAAAGQWRYTLLGGYALLLRPLLDCDFEPAAEWSTPKGAHPVAMFGLLALAAAAGRREGDRLLDDSLWRAILGLPERLTRADICDWMDQVGTGQWRRLGASFPGTRLPTVQLPLGLGSRDARAAIARLATSLLRALSGRLPGFALATAPFLRANILGAGASMKCEDDVVRIKLDRPPLDVLLSITGMGDRELAFPDGRTICLERRR